MREPITQLEKMRISKYESSVKKVVDELDLIDVFPYAPPGHYSVEIREITMRLSEAKCCRDIAEIMYIVFSFYFGTVSYGTSELYFESAVKLAKEIGLCKKCDVTSWVNK